MNKHIFSLFKCLVFLALFLLCLNGYYFPSLHFPIVPVVGVVFWCLLMQNYTEHSLCIFFIVVGVVGLSLFVNRDDILHPWRVLVSYFGLCTGIYLLIVTVGSHSRAKSKTVYAIINLILILLFLLWLLQFLAHYILEFDIDYFLPIINEPQRLYTFGGRLFRASSLFIEPSMYAWTLFGLLFCKLSYQNFKVDFFTIILVLSLLLTFSAYGYIVFIYILFIAITSNQNNKFFHLKYIVLLIVFMIIVIFWGSGPIAMVFTKIIHVTSTHSGEVRISGGLNYYLSNLNIINLLFGYGWQNSDELMNINNAYYFVIFSAGISGLCGFLILFWYYIKYAKNYKCYFVIFLLLFFAQNFSILVYPITWVIIGIAISFLKEEDLIHEAK